MKFSMGSAVLFLALIGAPGAAHAGFDQGDILIKFKPGTINFASQVSETIRGKSTFEVIADDWVRVQVASNQIGTLENENDLLAALRANPAVEFAQPNYRLGLIENYTSSDPPPGPRRYRSANILAAGKLLSARSRKTKPEIPAASVTPMLGPDPLAGQQWGFFAIHADEAQKITRGNKHLIVAVIDTGVDYTHEDLVGNIWHNPGEIPGNGIDDDNNGFIDDVIGWDFVDNDNRPYDVATGPLGTLLGGQPGHGTHCAGTIGAVGDNSIGITGISPNVSIMPVRFLNMRGQGTTAQAVKAINYAVKNGAKILSNSWGSEGEEPDNQALKDAIKNAMDKDVLFIAAAGNGHQGIGYDNDTDKKPAYPASYKYENIISVAAIDKTGALGKFSNWGKQSVHIAAPGVAILSTMVGSKYSDSVIKLGKHSIPWAGTSMAAPFVSGAAALVWAAHPLYKALDVKNKLLTTAEKLPTLTGKVVSDGKVNLAAAVR